MNLLCVDVVLHLHYTPNEDFARFFVVFSLRQQLKVVKWWTYKYDLAKNPSKYAIYQLTRKSGAEASAAAYSVIETCKLNGIQPYAYLKFVFTELPQLDLSRHPELLDRYMPWTDFIKKHCK